MFETLQNLVILENYSCYRWRVIDIFDVHNPTKNAFFLFNSTMHHFFDILPLTLIVRKSRYVHNRLIKHRI